MLTTREKSDRIAHYRSVFKFKIGYICSVPLIKEKPTNSSFEKMSELRVDTWNSFTSWNGSAVVPTSVLTRVADPDLLDPNVFGPPGPRSVSKRYRYRSGAFYHQARIVRKPWIPTVLRLLYYFIFLKNDVNVASKSNKQKNVWEKKNSLPSWRSLPKIAGSGSGSVSQRYGSDDPDPYQNFTDSQRWFNLQAQ